MSHRVGLCVRAASSEVHPHRVTDAETKLHSNITESTVHRHELRSHNPWFVCLWQQLRHLLPAAPSAGGGVNYKRIRLRFFLIEKQHRNQDALLCTPAESDFTPSTSSAAQWRSVCPDTGRFQIDPLLGWNKSSIKWNRMHFGFFKWISAWRSAGRLDWGAKIFKNQNLQVREKEMKTRMKMGAEERFDRKICWGYGAIAPPRMRQDQIRLQRSLVGTGASTVITRFRLILLNTFI